MARMSIDDFFLRDPRIVRLARLLGHVDPDTTRGKLLHVFSNCYDRRSAVVRREDVDVVIAGLADAMIACDLALDTPEGIRVAGAQERIDYLLRQAERGSKGGKESWMGRRRKRKGLPENEAYASASGFSGASAALQPSPVPDPSPSPVPDPVPPPDLIRTPASSGEPVPTRSPKGSPRASRRPPRRPLPDDWQPRAREIGVAAKAGLDVSEQADRFRSHALMNGRTLVDWDEAFRNWLTSPYQKQGQARAERQDPIDAWLEHERQRKANEEAQSRMIDVDDGPRRRS